MCRPGGGGELLILCSVVVADWAPTSYVSDLAEEFMTDWFPLGYLVPVRVTGPQVYSWLQSKGLVPEIPVSWKWSMKPSRAPLPPADTDIPF